MGPLESLAEYYPEAEWQRCTVHFYRNVFTNVPSTKVKEVAATLKRCRTDEVRNVSILVAFGVNENGYLEILGSQKAPRKTRPDCSAPLFFGPLTPLISA